MSKTPANVFCFLTRNIQTTIKPFRPFVVISSALYYEIMSSKLSTVAETLTSLLKRRYDYVSMLQEKSPSERVWLARCVKVWICASIADRIRSDSKLFVLKESPMPVYKKSLGHYPESLSTAISDDLVIAFRIPP